ncbi:MAG: hypothetical protein ACRD0N_07645 [Acidimicrobiales bacterium]
MPAPLPVLKAESRLRRRAVKHGFGQGIAADLDSIRGVLPERCTRILDIGCGVAAIDALLHRLYLSRGSVAQSFLLDRSELPSAIAYGYRATSSFYNSLEVAVELLMANGVERSQVHLLEPRPEAIQAIQPVDLTVSLISWGFHYPVATYLDAVAEATRPGGTVVLDVRKGTGGEHEIERAFGHVEALFEDAKRWRLAAVKR